MPIETTKTPPVGINLEPWANGKKWKFVRGDDFVIKADSFARMARHWLTRNNRSGTVERRGDDVFVKITPENGE